MFQIEATAVAATFDAAIAQDAGLDFDVPIPGAIGAPYGSAQCMIKGLVLVAEENLSWELWLWSKAARAGASYNVDSWLGRWTFLAADAVRVSGNTRYYYFVPSLEVPYRDDDVADVNGLLHCTLIPRGAAHVIHKLLLVKIYCQSAVPWT